jgi:DNA-binding LacI/PurR family transcriptional regulator
MPPAALRLDGYLRAIVETGLDEDVVTVTGADYTEESGAAAGRQLLGRPELPTAIVTGNDQEAVGVMQVLARAGVSIPDDVSLTGFDDSRFARLSSVDLTTARQDAEEMGKAAVSAVVRRIGRPALRPSLSVVEPSLVVRSSTGPAR